MRPEQDDAEFNVAALEFALSNVPFGDAADKLILQGDVSGGAKSAALEAVFSLVPAGGALAKKGAQRALKGLTKEAAKEVVEEVVENAAEKFVLSHTDEAIEAVGKGANDLSRHADELANGAKGGLNDRLALHPDSPKGMADPTATYCFVAGAFVLMADGPADPTALRSPTDMVETNAGGASAEPETLERVYYLWLSAACVIVAGWIGHYVVATESRRRYRAKQAVQAGSPEESEANGVAEPLLFPLYHNTIAGRPGVAL